MRVLVLGGTGAMGVHVCRLLADRGDEVVATTRRGLRSRDGVTYLRGDAKSSPFLCEVLAEGWDCVLDFMVWSTDEFRARYDVLLESCGQYVFLSSYRVYADSPVITEDSPRLLDVIDDAEYLATDEYALSKARCEDLLAASGRTNWTVVRPAITYDGSVGRLQLGVMESAEWLWRATRGIRIPMPGEMQERQATMTYAGDVARMIARLVGNPSAHGEAFTVATSEHLSWREVAEAYARLVPLRLESCSLERFVAVRGGAYQVRYDRMFDRVVDNSKVLDVTGIDKASLMPVREGLARELGRYLESPVAPVVRVGSNARLDRIVGGVPSLCGLLRDAREAAPVAFAKYAVRRFVR